MDPATVFCPHLVCPARGQTGQGNIGIPSRKDKRFLCTQCHKTFTTTKGTVFYRLRTSAELVVMVVTLLADGCPLQAIGAAFGFDERTVAAWGRAPADRDKLFRSSWWSNRGTSDRGRPTRYASSASGASCGWRWL